MDLDHPILAGYSHLAESDLPADPERQHMGSGDHLNSQQFADHIQTVTPKPGTSPALHDNPLGWYGEPQAEGDPR